MTSSALEATPPAVTLTPPAVSFEQLVTVPHRQRSTAAGNRKRLAPPSYNLTSDIHFDFVSAKKLAKADKPVKKTVRDNKLLGRKLKKTDLNSETKNQKQTVQKHQKIRPTKSNEKTGSEKRKVQVAKSTDNRPIVTMMPTAHDDVPFRCLVCNIVEKSAEDMKLGRDWISCGVGHVWMHEPCAEQSGILDDEDFTCQSCC